MRSTSLPRRLVAVAAAALVAALLVPAVALGAAAPLDRLSGLTIMGSGGAPVLIVSATLPKDAKLPATVEIPVPDGATLSWSGEILGGDPGKDPAREARIEKRDGHSVAVFTLEQARIGQIEVELPKPAVSEVTTLSASMYVPNDVKAADIAVRVPAGATIKSSLDGLTKREGPNGFAEYGKVLEPAKAGTTLEAEVGYEAQLGTVANPNVVSGQAAPQAPASTASSDAVLWLVLAVVAVAAFFVIRGVSRRMSEKNVATVETRSSAPSKSSGSKATRVQTNAAPAKAAGTKKKISPAMIIVGVAVVAGLGAVALAYEPQKKVTAGTSEVGGVQVIQIDTSSGDFDPGEFRAKAGKPIKLVLGSGTSCASRITFPDLGIDRDLTNGAEIDIPALEAGRYAYNCSSGSESGALIVE